MGRVVRIEELAAIVGMSDSTLRRHRAAGMPVIGEPSRGRVSQFDTEAVIQWLIDKAVGQRVGAQGEELLDLEQERARLAHVQADKTELEVRRLQGDLIPVAELSAAWASIGEQIRAAILNRASRVAPLVFGLETVEEVTSALHDEDRRALEALQDSGVPEFADDEVNRALH